MCEHRVWFEVFGSIVGSEFYAPPQLHAVVVCIGVPHQSNGVYHAKEQDLQLSIPKVGRGVFLCFCALLTRNRNLEETFSPTPTCIWMGYYCTSSPKPNIIVKIIHTGKS